jgi:hypothetical protein
VPHVVARGVHGPGRVCALLSADGAAGPNFLVGVRFGVVANAYPSGGAAVGAHRAFGAHVHFEGRVTYVVGDAPLSSNGLAPCIFVAAGVVPFDVHATTVASISEGMGHVPLTQPVNAWQTAGPFFIAAWGGERYQLSQCVAFGAQLLANRALGGANLFTFGPEVLQFGF